MTQSEGGKGNTETVGETAIGWLGARQKGNEGFGDRGKGAGTAGGHYQEVVNLGLEPGARDGAQSPRHTVAVKAVLVWVRGRRQDKVGNWVTHFKELEISHRLKGTIRETSSVKAGVFVFLIIVVSTIPTAEPKCLWSSGRKENEASTVSQKPRVGGWRLVTTSSAART